MTRKRPTNMTHTSQPVLPAPAKLLFKGVGSLGWHFIDGRFVRIDAGGVVSADSGATDNHYAEDRSDAGGLAEKDLRCGGPKGPISQEGYTVPLLRERIPNVLSGYRLPPPSSGQDLKKDIAKSMRLLDFGPNDVAVLMYASIWRAHLDICDFAICINGTKWQSTKELASLYLQHFGVDLDAGNPVITWRDTYNYRTGVMAAARHVLVPVAGLVREKETNRTCRAATGFFRSLGNAGRRRCNSDGTPHAPDPPGGLPMFTGDASLLGPSPNARIVNINLPHDPVFDLQDEATSTHLSAFQGYAREGAFARVNSAFIKWLAPQYEEKRRQMHEQAAEFRRGLFLSRCGHLREATVKAELLSSLEIFFEFLLDIEFVDDSGFERL